MEPLNSLDLEVVRRALAAPEMERYAQQVVAICAKLGVAAPAWATERLPPPGEPPRGS